MDNWFIEILIIHYCPGEEAAIGIIVVSLPYTANLWATFMTFY